MSSYAIRGLVAAIVLSICSGCKPELGAAPFLCNPPPGKPRCPDGYRCQRYKGREVCILDGVQVPHQQPPHKDSAGPAADTGKTKDAGGQDSGKTGAEKVVVTEFLANPRVVPDADGEWLELYNPGSKPVNLNGWTLKDKGTDLHKIQAPGGKLLVPAGGFVLIGANMNRARNGNVAVAYAFKQFFLANGSDEIVLVDGNNRVVDELAYSTALGFRLPDGASLSIRRSLNPVTADKSRGANWCAEQKPWSGSAGDKGTPGQPPICN